MRILVTEQTYEQYADLARAVVDDPVFVLFADDGSMRTETGDPVTAGSEDVEVVWATHDLFVGRSYLLFFELLSTSPTIRWFQSPGAGTDGAFFSGLLQRGVRLSTSHVTSIPIAEFVLRSVLDVYQRPDTWVAVRARHAWDHHVMREVHGTTWLVVGLGAIGSDVALRARAFGARVIGCRRHPTGDEPVDEMIGPSEVQGRVADADVVVIAAPATPESYHLVDAALLAAMKPRSVLVNVARGSLVDEDALLAALETGRPEVAILDAVATEPPPDDSPLWDHPRIVLTPHNSFAGDGCDRRNVELFVENLRRYVAGAELINEQHPAPA